MIPPWTLVLGYEHAIRKFANKLVSQEGYKLGEALKKAWKDATIKESISSLRYPSTASGLLKRRQLHRQGLRGPARAARKVARRALRARKGSRPRTSQARAPLGRLITIPSASATMLKEDARRVLSATSSATMLKEDARRVLSATSPMCARYASGSARDTSAPRRPARQPIHRALPTPDLGRPSRGRYCRLCLRQRQLRSPCEFYTFSPGLRDAGICRAA